MNESKQQLLRAIDSDPVLAAEIEDMLADELVKQIEIEKFIEQVQYEIDAEWLAFADRFLACHNRNQNETC